MAKSYKKINYEEVEREDESPAHISRRIITQKIRNYAMANDGIIIDDDEYEEFETFVRIRPKHQKKR